MYVKRDKDGRIMAVSTAKEADFDERIKPDDEELQAFLNQVNGEPEARDQAQQLRALDKELSRVLEDLITLLTDKGVIQFTDLPPAAQEKLLQRKNLRQDIRRVDLVDDDDTEELPL